MMNQSEERAALRRYLNKYKRARKHKATLQQRLSDLRLELSGPSVKPLSSDNIRAKGKNGTGAEGPALQIIEIEEKINKQIAKEAQLVLDVMNVIDLLESGSIEREILEARHIDCISWRKTEFRVHLTRSPCFEHYNKALDYLLSIRKVRVLIEID